MSVAAYITYNLFNYDGSGIQPYRQVAQCGMDFDGGHYNNNGRMLGYLMGDASKVNITLLSLSLWGAQQLTAGEAMAWAELSVPINTSNEDSDGTIRYIGPAILDGDGFIDRQMSETEW